MLLMTRVDDCMADSEQGVAVAQGLQPSFGAMITGPPEGLPTRNGGEKLQLRQQDTQKRNRSYHKTR